MKQFPWWVQEALALPNFDDINAIAQILNNLDVIRLEKQTARMNHRHRMITRETGHVNKY